LQKRLAEQGVQTLIHYPVPPHKQLAYSGFNNLNFPITEAIHGEVLSLPIGPSLILEEIESVMGSVKRVIN
jgi:dTDP-4-amino-4,6-dideoxygalactose transaminase